MQRRHGPSFKRLLIAGLLLISPGVVVEAQQQQRQQRQYESPPEGGLDRDVSPTLEATRVPQQSLEVPLTHERRKNTKRHTLNDQGYSLKHNDASAVATSLAPAQLAVRAPSPRNSLSTAQVARSLEDWVVEDFVLLATVDGKLYARDRKTGQEKWALEWDRPMVETTYHRRNRSIVDEDYKDIDDYLWIIEPSRDGSIYFYRPSMPGVVSMDLTMKEIVEVYSPYSDDHLRIVYTGEKKTSAVTIDARTGNVLNWFGSTDDQKDSCLRPNEFIDPKSEECTGATITLGRTEYKVNIRHKDDSHPIAELKFSEWTPNNNNYNANLFQQYQASYDGKYVYSSHDGTVLGVDHAPSNDNNQRPLFKHKFSAPVVRVFDVARPWDNDENPELMVLPQPMAPLSEDDDVSENVRQSSIFLNHTEAGSWYAMSAKQYPFVVHRSQPAQCNQEDWRQLSTPWDGVNQNKFSEALVGLHSIESTGPPLGLPAPADDNISDTPAIVDHAPALFDHPPSSLLEQIGALPARLIHSLIELLKNPVLILVLVGLLIRFRREIIKWCNSGGIWKWIALLGVSKHISHKAETSVAPVEVQPEESGPLPTIPEDKPIAIVPPVDVSTELAPQSTPEGSAAKDVIPEMKDTPAVLVDPEVQGTPSVVTANPNEPEKKKRARGRRGGQKHKKGKRAESQDPSSDTPQKMPPTVEDAVRDAQNMGPQKFLEPDIHTVSTDPSDVSGNTIMIGALKVDTGKLIGTGSNGTMVFEGEFDGRPVAVKRMLEQFTEIASQETKLLRESDDHPNVIRYFAQQKAAGFLYIALELCPASLAEVIEKPHLHRDLAQSGEQDLPGVLYQITNGLRHLHNLRIVHRDLKPQNILVAMGKDNKPRLLVSDFGLCKKLEGEQSSFRATTAHAAGTSGWRAPELLLDDDAQQGSSMVDASTDGHSSSHNLVSPELMPNRRATRAIDIFSLGLVFFYVLTKGSHPFDCGDKYMREVNIRKGKYNLKSLAVLGDFAAEAEELIGSMLASTPKHRPTARDVMAHPFFWSAKKRLLFLCDVSDHFEKECRDPPSKALQYLETYAPDVCRGDFLKPLGKEFVESMGKQRKYTGTRLLDLLRALRNKRNHYEDMSDRLKKEVGPLPDGYLSFWTRKFPNLLITCWNVVYEVDWHETDRFREYYEPGIF